MKTIVRSSESKVETVAVPSLINLFSIKLSACRAVWGLPAVSTPEEHPLTESFTAIPDCFCLLKTAV